MSTEQVELDFAKKHARATDPETSHLAAESAVSLAESHRRVIIQTMRQSAYALTSEEIAAACDLTHAQVWRRVSELREDSRLYVQGKRKNSSNRWAQCYRLCDWPDERRGRSPHSLGEE